jgi:hypothetical protein
MKKLINYPIILLISFVLYSCGVNDSFNQIDNTPPAPPTGITVVNGDNRVDLTWNNNYESDLAGYNVYYAYSYNGKYTLIGSTSDNYFIDDGASNGTTYYYAVTAYDYNGNESDLSYDVIYSTPRPEGFNQAISDFRRFPEISGYTFDDFSVVSYDDPSTDFFFGVYNGVDSIMIWDNANIMDMGPTQDIYDIPYAPQKGWTNAISAVAIPEHTYVIWTRDNHYAKVRISQITSNRMVFDWAFQLVQGERQLKPRKSSGDRKSLSKVRSGNVESVSE